MVEIPVLDKGFVRLDDSMAGDLSVVNSARVSFAQRSEYDMVCTCVLEHAEPGSLCAGECYPYNPVLKAPDAGLIRFLMRGRHGTPFEHNAFRFHVKCPIFVAREWMRHRIGSFNEWSGRYSKLESEFYIPLNVRSQTGKPGSYTFESKNDVAAVEYRQDVDAHSKRAYGLYEIALASGIAKEQARLFLPVNIYTQFYWTINARSLMNFLSLRNADAAMYEIREYAKVVEDIFAEKMPVTHDAFIENGRVAP